VGATGDVLMKPTAAIGRGCIGGWSALSTISIPKNGEISVIKRFLLFDVRPYSIVFIPQSRRITCGGRPLAAI